MNLDFQGYLMGQQLSQRKTGRLDVVFVSSRAKDGPIPMAPKVLTGSYFSQILPILSIVLFHAQLFPSLQTQRACQFATPLPCSRPQHQDANRPFLHPSDEVTNGENAPFLARKSIA